MTFKTYQDGILTGEYESFDDLIDDKKIDENIEEYGYLSDEDYESGYREHFYSNDDDDDFW